MCYTMRFGGGMCQMCQHGLELWDFVNPGFGFPKSWMPWGTPSYPSCWSCCSWRNLFGEMGSLSFQKHLYGGFLKWGCHQIIHFNRIFHYKPSDYWGIPIYGNLQRWLGIGLKMLDAVPLPVFLMLSLNGELMINHGFLCFHILRHHIYIYIHIYICICIYIYMYVYIIVHT